MGEPAKPESHAFRLLIQEQAGEVDLELETDAVQRLAEFAVLFLKWNERINLSSVSTAGDLVERHFVDSFVASRFVPIGARVVDVGSGGGLPALPLAAFRSDLSMECFEPIQKKGAFLRTAVRELGVGDRVRIRGEAVQRPVPAGLTGRADVAMSRATLEPAAWLELGRALARPGGRVLVFATQQSQAGLPEAAQSLTYGRGRRLLCFE